MDLDGKTSALIADIYAGAHDQARWDRAMTAIGDRLNAQFLMVATADRTRDDAPRMGFYHVRHDRFDDAITEYAADTHRMDPTMLHIQAHPHGGVFHSVGEIDRMAYLDHPYVRWNIDTGGSMFWTALHRAEPGGLSFGIALHRSPAAGPLSVHDTTELSLLFDHVRNAVSLAAHPPLIEEGDATLLLDTGGYVVRANEAARLLVQSRDAITIVDGRLRATHRRSVVPLDQAVRDVLTPMGSDRSVVIERTAALPLLCRLRALDVPDARRFLPASATALVRFVDPEVVAGGCQQSWRALFGLTMAEARLVGHLIETDGSLRDIADALGVTYGTVRTQLASIFAKVGVRSQSQLVRLMIRLN